MTLAEPTTLRWTKDQYMKLAEQGHFEGKRVQLIDGEILQMAPQGHDHASALRRATKLLESLFEPQHWVRTQLQLDLGNSQPEPDVAVAEHDFGWYRDHPTTAMLVVEISDSSLYLDRRKALLYTAARVPEYWIVNLPDRKIEVYRRPKPDQTEKLGYRYVDRFESRDTETISPLSRPQAVFTVKSFFE